MSSIVRALLDLLSRRMAAALKRLHLQETVVLEDIPKL